VVLTTQKFYFSLPISQLMAKAIPVRGARFKEARAGDCAGFLLSLFFAACLFEPSHCGYDSEAVNSPSVTINIIESNGDGVNPTRR